MIPKINSETELFIGRDEMKSHNRRQFLKASAALAAGTAVMQSSPIKALSEPFPGITNENYRLYEETV